MQQDLKPSDLKTSNCEEGGSGLDNQNGQESRDASIKRAIGIATGGFDVVDKSPRLYTSELFISL